MSLKNITTVSPRPVGLGRGPPYTVILPHFTLKNKNIVKNIYIKL